MGRCELPPEHLLCASHSAGLGDAQAGQTQLLSKARQAPKKTLQKTSVLTEKRVKLRRIPEEETGLFWGEAQEASQRKGPC